MDLVSALLSLLVLHAGLGAVDTIVSHEWRERLPHQPWAGRELALHSLRSLLFVAIFYGLAWYEWRGVFGWLIVAVVLAEYAITIGDSLVEDRTRRLSILERVNHMLLALNTGVYASLLALLVATDWRHAPTRLVPAHHPPLLVAMLTFAAAAVAGWAVRDGLASFRMRKRAARASPGRFAVGTRSVPERPRAWRTSAGQRDDARGR
jgi:hypothetical protein